MRKLDNTPQSDTLGMPVKAGIWEHLQLAYQEAINAISLSLVGPSYLATKGYILFGCVNSGSGLNYVISAGAIFYNGEVYLVDAKTFTADGGQVAVAAIATTQYTNGDRADPIQFTDGGNRNVLNIRKIVFSSGATGSGIFDLANALQNKLGVVNDQEATLGASYTVSFSQDRFAFFASATVSTDITFDFTNAVVGCVVRLKWTWGSGLALTVTPPGSSVAYEEGGDITRAASSTNTMYFTYLGKNESGDDEVGYSISQVA